MCEEHSVLFHRTACVRGVASHISHLKSHIPYRIFDIPGAGLMRESRIFSTMPALGVSDSLHARAILLRSEHKQNQGNHIPPLEG